MSSVTVEKLNNTAIITLNRPETLNAIDKSLLLELENALHEASQQKDVPHIDQIREDQSKDRILQTQILGHQNIGRYHTSIKQHGEGYIKG